MQNKHKIEILFSILMFLFILSFNKNDNVNSDSESTINQYPNTSAGEISIKTPEKETYSSLKDGYYPATYGFENDKIGTFPKGWIDGSSSGCSVSISGMVLGHKNVLTLNDGSNPNYGKATQIFSSGGQQNGTVEFWFLATDLTSHRYFLIHDTTEANRIHMWLSIDGNFKYYDGVTTYTICAAVLNQWQHIKIEWNCSDSWHLWINGDQKDSEGYSFEGNPTALDRIILQTHPSGNNYNYHLDALGYSWDPNYDIGDNYNKGILLGFNNATNLDWIGYSLDGQSNKTILGNITLPRPNKGEHYIQVFGNDSSYNQYASNIQHFSVADIDILTPGNLTYNKTDYGYYPATYGWETDTVGGNPANWTIWEAAGTINVIDTYQDHKKVVEFSDTIPTGDVHMDVQFASQDEGSIEWWWCSDSNTKPTAFLLFDSSTWLIQITIGSSGFIHYTTTGGGTINCVPFSINQWYHFRMDFNSSSDTYDLYINRELIVEDAGYRIAGGPLTHIQITSSGLNEDYKSYIDAIAFSWDDAYDIGDNKYSGLCLTFDNYTELDWIGFSFDSQPNKTIYSNRVIPIPSNGTHTIQIFGNDSLGVMYSSEKRIFTMEYLPLNLITPENITYYSPMEGYYPATYGFENDPTGGHPSEWSFDDLGGSIKIYEDLNNHRKIIEMNDTNTDDCHLYQNIQPQTTGKIELWVLMDDVTDVWYYRLKDGGFGGTSGVQIGIQSEKLGYYTGGWTWFQDVSDNTWYHLMVDFDTNTDKMDIYVNGLLKVDNENFDAGITDIDCVTFSTHPSLSNYKIYLDAIGYSWDSDYDIEDNLNEGILIGIDGSSSFSALESSFDSQPIKIIQGNNTFKIPNDGVHSIKIFGINNTGYLFKTEERIFTTDIQPYIKWLSPINSELVILPPGDAIFHFQYTSRKIEAAELYINGTYIGDVWNKSSVVINPYTPNLDGYVNATLIGKSGGIPVAQHSINITLAKLVIDVKELLDYNTKYLGQQLYLILHDPNGDNSYSGFIQQTGFSLGIGASVSIGCGFEIGIGDMEEDVGASVGLEFKKSTNHDLRLEITRTTELTSNQETSNKNFIGPGKGDTYWGEAWSVTWKLIAYNRTYFNGTSRYENPKLDYTITRGGEVLLNDYYAPQIWRDQNPVHNNYTNVQWLPPIPGISGTIPYTKSEEVSKSESRKVSFEMTFKEEVGGKIPAIDVGLKYTCELSIEAYMESEITNTYTTSYTIFDDEPTDLIAMEVGIDKKFGTPIFKPINLTCATSKPLEYDTFDYVAPVVDFPEIEYDTSYDGVYPSEDDEPIISVKIDDEGGIQEAYILYSFNGWQNYDSRILTEQIANPLGKVIFRGFLMELKLNGTL